MEISMRHSISADMNRPDRLFPLLNWLAFEEKKNRSEEMSMVVLYLQVAIPIDCIYSRGESRDKTHLGALFVDLVYFETTSNIQHGNFVSVRKSIAFRFAKQVNSIGSIQYIEFHVSLRYTWIQLSHSFEFWR